MTSPLAATQLSAHRSQRRKLSVPAMAGGTFVIAWILGLAAWPSSLDVSTPAAQVLLAYAAHRTGAATQYLLVEGVAGIALGSVVIGLGRAATTRAARRTGGVLMLAGLVAAAISLLECAVGLTLCGQVTPASSAHHAWEMFELINRLDGVKMLALATAALAALRITGRRGLLPRWMGWVSGGLAVAMLVAGVGFLLLVAPLTQAAAPALVLLLVWVAAGGILADRVGR